MASKKRGKMARSEEVHPCDCDAFEDADDDDDFEEWEAYAELIERKEASL